MALDPGPSEPLHVFGGECPEGYDDKGNWACHRDESKRCPGCDKDDESVPTFCGHGVKVYRSRAWDVWAKRVGLRR